MKTLNLEQLQPDPLTLARYEAKFETITVSGYVINTDKKTISLTKNKKSKSYCEYPRNSIIAAFESNKKPNKVTLLIKKETDVKNISYSKVNDKNCSCKGDKEPEIMEARPWKSIHPEIAKQLAEMRRIIDSVGNGPGATFLSCREKFDDCKFDKEKSYDDCRFEENICLHKGTFR
jgi:hypothetical protein